MKVVSIEEEAHKIEFQFEIMLEWYENNRVEYHNLKKKTALNALTQDDIKKLWLPLILYANTDQTETTRLGENWEWSTSVTVTREGEFTRAPVKVMDEAEIFQAEENKLTMIQTYTHEFQCIYELRKYPFDTQVNIMLLVITILIFSGVHNQDDNGKT